MEATKEQINQAALSLRHRLDREWENLVDTFASEKEADAVLKPLYDAVTLLHEQAMKVAV